jgi:uncharacterized protein YjbJ (UPF0337 family)
VTNPEIPQRTRGGLAGKLAGRAKQAAGVVLGNEDLAREGRLQQAQVEAEADAVVAAERAGLAEDEAAVEAARTENEIERERLENEIAEREREEAIERDRLRAERAAQAEAAQREAAADLHERGQESAAAAAEDAAERERAAAARDAAELRAQARRAETVADTIDPEER